MKKIIIVSGDPNSINSEIIYKAWKKLSVKLRKKIYVIGNRKLFNEQFKKLKIKHNILNVKNIDVNLKSENLKIINIDLKYTSPFDVKNNSSSKYVMESLNLAHRLACTKNIKGLINCPVDKKLIKKSKKNGVTEFLASKCNINDQSEIMFIHNKKFSVVPITTHLQIKKVHNKITKNLIIKKIISLNNNYKKIFKNKPKIGILGLNPHNNEFKRNSEEITEILPAIKYLKRINININGPLSADTAFIERYKNFNVIVGMYHDQVITPFKTIFHYDAINVTLGLNYLRVSPDHGPATDLLGKNKANPTSLIECIHFINNQNK